MGNDPLQISARDRIDPRERLVEKNERRSRGKRARYLHAAALPARERRCPLASEPAEPELLKERRAAPSRLVGAQPQRLQHGEEIVLDAHPAEYGSFLR